MKTIVILAGGKSTRMGKDKIFLHIHYNKKETFLEHLYYNAAAVFEKVIISAGSKDRVLTIRKLCHRRKLFRICIRKKGPMGGIVSVYEQTGCEKFAVIPVDVPAATWMCFLFLGKLQRTRLYFKNRTEIFRNL